LEENQGVTSTPVQRGFVFLPKWQNFGNTPATNVSIYRDFKLISQNDEFPHFEVEDLHPGYAIVPPGEFFGTSPIGITAEEYISFSEDKIRIAIFALIEYKDIFAERTHFIETALLGIHQGGYMEQEGRGRMANIVFQPVSPQNQVGQR
jgi:hypothetical protein